MEILHIAGFDVLVPHAGRFQLLLQRKVVADGRERCLVQVEIVRAVSIARRQIEELVARAADHHHVVRAGVDQHVRHEPAALLMVGADRRDAAAQHTVEGDDGGGGWTSSNRSDGWCASRR